MESGETSVLTVMFADVVGSTQLYERLGNDRALREVEQCLKRLGDAAREQGGTIIKTVGDEIMCTFKAPNFAVIAATTMQQVTEAQSGISNLQLRIGFQHGDVIERNDDVFGDVVNVAARLTSIAKPGQILTTRETVEKLPAFMQAGVRDHESVAMKGKTDEVAVSEIIWQQEGGLTMMERTPAPKTQIAVSLVIETPTGQVILGKALHSATFGRDPNSMVVLNHPKASRNHARIEQRRDKFILVDSSSNGTWIHFDGSEPIRLRLEEAILARDGLISFGETPDAPTALTMRFVLS